MLASSGINLLRTPREDYLWASAEIIRRKAVDVNERDGKRKQEKG